MLNKKAIAAFAAGATLVSGLVFAAPAMAEKPMLILLLCRAIKLLNLKMLFSTLR